MLARRNWFPASATSGPSLAECHNRKRRESNASSVTGHGRAPRDGGKHLASAIFHTRNSSHRRSFPADSVNPSCGRDPQPTRDLTRSSVKGYAWGALKVKKEIRAEDF